MTTIELARLVRDMRDAQRTYFRERTIERLQESKEKERALDKVVKEIIEDRAMMLPLGENE